MFDPVDCNLSSLGGPRGAAVTDSIFQELDLRTGLVRREWHSLDHVALSESYSSATSASTVWPFDYFHLNSVDQLAERQDADLRAQHLRPVRTEHAHRPGADAHRRQALERASWRAGAATAYQHDASVLANGTISVFDNGGVPKVHSQSRG